MKNGDLGNKQERGCLLTREKEKSFACLIVANGTTRNLFEV
jgi:hypothetical protein